MERLFDSELKVMELVWENEPAPAKQLAQLAAERIGWNKNTTYTILTKLVKKGVLRREDPNFVCSAVVKRNEVQRAETNALIDRLYHGSKQAFFAAFLQNESLSAEELALLREMVQKQ